MSISSHITIPKVVLRKFVSADDSRFYLIDYSSAPHYYIRRGNPKSFNTKKNYYTTEVEEFLSKNVENHINLLLKQASDIHDEVLVQNEIIQNYAFSYLESLIARDKTFHNERAESPSEIVLIISRLLKEKGSVRSKYNASYLVNHSNIPFVLPSNGIVQINETDIICPLSPHIALLFYNSIDNYYKVAADDNLIMRINRLAFKQALNNMCLALICNQRSILEKLKEEHSDN